ncbi:PTS glucose transporter subunit IIA [[Clostridium] innocuum]|nr:PTS glucose transporter subunit IIA [[Clostridium] innocuum]
MFGFRKKEKSREELLAVVDGTLIPIEDVKDPVFSQKMMGDGLPSLLQVIPYMHVPMQI